MIKLDENVDYNDFIKITEKFNEFTKNVIPLCAAENVISDFVRLPLISKAHEKYVMGGLSQYDYKDNFIGGDIIYSYYQVINNQCKKLFKSTYADSRTLTGMNSITTLLMSVTTVGDTIAIISPDCGGHASIPFICKRLGLSIVYIPYDYQEYNIDYDKLNNLMRTTKIDTIFICISDIVNTIDFTKINHEHNILIIYDATPILGLIAGGIIDNPLIQFDNYYPFILCGATHKTIPGPSCSLIMTKNSNLANSVEEKINPVFLRNTQMHHKISLIFALIELEYFGFDYASQILVNSKKLSQSLQLKGFNVLNQKNGYTNTHQIFFTDNLIKIENFYNQCLNNNVTVDFKNKEIFSKSGIRIGVQEITRYGWDDIEINMVADLLYMLMYTKNNKRINNLIVELSKRKKIKYTFESSEYKLARKLISYK